MEKKQKKKLYMMEIMYPRFQYQVTATEDIHTPTGGIRPGKKEKILTFRHGFYETDDIEEQKFLDTHPSATGPDPTRRFAPVADNVVEIINALESKNVPRVEWHKRVKSILEALSSNPVG